MSLVCGGPWPGGDETLPLLAGVSGPEDPAAAGSRSHPLDMVVQPSACVLHVDRPVYLQSTLQDTFRDPSSQSIDDACQPHGLPCMSCSPGQSLHKMVPAVAWLRDYQWRHDFLRDLISGCTVAVMNIPQGMAYALLGNVPPVVGIYMAIFPALVYSFLGTSRHVAMGSFAVICLMTGKVVSEYATLPGAVTANSTTPAITGLPTYSPLEVATAVSFMVAIYQLTMYVFRMGIMCSLLSETLINGFTAGGAIHVFTSQIKDLLGLKVPNYHGNFQLIYTYMGIFKNLMTINKVASMISLVTVAVLLLDTTLIKPWVSKRSVFPVPMELVTVLLGTVASTIWDLSGRYNLTTVGHISIGFPEFRAPNFELLPMVALDSFIIALIAYIITISMALIFAHKLKYEIDPNQELLAQGAGNLVGSFLSCMPFAASLSRSMIQQSVGGCTQLASVICAGILTVVLLSVGPVFEPLPRCILASLIVVALKGMLLQVKDVVRIWKTSAMDGIVWVSTYLTVVIVEIDVGLLVGLAVSILTIVFRGLRPSIYQLSRLPNTDIYVESNRYTKVEDIRGICVVRYAGGLNFANRTCFKDEIVKLMERGVCSATSSLSVKSNKVLPIEMETKVCFLVLDMSGMQYVDPSGAGALQSLAAQLNEVSVSIYLATTSGSVSEVLQKCGIYDSPNVLSFPTVHDAVLFAQNKLPKMLNGIR